LKPLYLDPKAPVDERVRDLLSRMTLEEKVAQLGSVTLDSLLDEAGRFSVERARAVLRYGIGQITRVAGSGVRDLRPHEVASMVNAIQRFLVTETRLGIPAIVHEECLAGVMGRGATMFPHPIGLASTWDPELVERVASAIRSEMLAIGARQGLAPVLDVALDPRWGRVEETFGEDPYLVAVMGASYVRGLQGGNIASGVVATPKHFAGHSFSEGGRNIAPVHIGPREFREIFLLPFEAAVRVSNALSIMPAYHVVDGIPCHANRDLLTGILRDEWGFQGYTVSDYGGIEMLRNVHGVAGSDEEAAAQALLAGVDIELPRTRIYGEPLIQAVKKGLVSEADIDRAVSRVLRVKFLLGLFENPFVDEAKVYAVVRSKEHRELSRRAARESIVLLKNDGALPIPGWARSIAVVGPNADNPLALLGDYSYPVHLRRDPEGVATILQSIRARAGGGVRVRYAPGCEDTACRSSSGFQEAIRAASESDFVVAVFGEVSGLFGRGFSGEGNDRSTLKLPGLQEDLLVELCSTGTPVAVVLLNGRPLELERVSSRCSAILEAWYPGEEGGGAVAEILFGDHSPGGKLPISFPRSVGQIPAYYHRRPSSFRDYVDASSRPLYPFGHGLSYTRFEYRNLRIQPEVVRGEEHVEISFEVANVGEREGDEVAQLYIRDPVASVSRPIKELKGFKRVHLKPGEVRRVSIRVHVDQLAFYSRDLRLVVEPGLYEVLVGSSSEDIRLRGSFQLAEGPRVLRARRAYFSEAYIA